LEATEEARRKFIEAMDDDFNTARAIGHLFDLGRIVNQARDAGVPASALAASQEQLQDLAGVLGLTLQETRVAADPAPFRDLATAIRNELLAAGKTELAESIPEAALAEKPTGEAEPLIELLVSVRSGLRAAKEYQLADRVRDGLAHLGIITEDGADGSSWRQVTSSQA
jgi:cysteinyl-tRNA synthetase